MPDDFEREPHALPVPNVNANRRTKEARIARLRERLARAKALGSYDDLCAVVGGALDLLSDEL